MNEPSPIFNPHFSSRYTIAVIGAGQVGSRHLQGLAGLTALGAVYAVDPSEAALEMARERFTEVAPPGGESILHLLPSIRDLPKELDLVIVATSSNVRAQVIRALTIHARVGALIMEKVLFQRLSEYEEIEELLKKKGVPCWVNCCYRKTEFYLALKRSLAGRGKISMRVSGPSWWGLGCNAVHFMDLLVFFSGTHEVEFDDVQLDDRVLDAKRPGFKEFTGRLSCRTEGGDRLTLECAARDDIPWVLEVEVQGARWSIGNPFDDVRCEEVVDGRQQTIETSIPFQSQRTETLVREILESGTCSLPTYEAAAELHRPLVRVLLDHYRSVTGLETDVCPIT